MLFRSRKVAAEPRRRMMAGLRRYRRPLLLVVLPIAAALGGLAFYLHGGRYVGTDDAYVGAQKVLITFRDAVQAEIARGASEDQAAASVLQQFERAGVRRRLDLTHVCHLGGMISWLPE